MAVLSLSAGTSSINKISSTFINMRRSLSNTRTVISDTKRVILNRTKIKSEAVFRSKGLFQKRQDNLRKKEAEDQLEASSLGSILSPGFATEKSILNSGKGFLGRILSAIAYLGVGWLLRNLPTWIGMAKEFVARIYKGVAVIKQFFMGAIGFVGNMFNLLGAVAQNIMSFDFFDTSNRVKDTFGQLNQNLSDMSSSIDDALRLMTTSLNEGIASGQNAPPLGTQGESQFSERESQFPDVDSGPVPKNDREAFEKVRAAAQRVGSPAPDVTAAIAMWETGWLRNPNSVYFASKKTNPFGQTGTGSGGYVIGADGQKHAVYKTFDEGVATHVRLWKNYYKGNSADEILRSLVAAGYNTASPGWRPNIAGVYERMTKKSKNSPISGQGTPGPAPSGIPQSSTSGGTLLSQGTFIQGSTGRSTGPHFHFGPGPANAKLAQQGDVFPGKFYGDVRDVAFKVGRYFLNQRKSFLLSRSGRTISPGISDGDLQKALYDEQRSHTTKGSDGGIDMAFADNVRLPMPVSDVKDRGDGFGISGTITGTNVFVAHGAKGSTSSGISAMPSMDGESLTPSTSPDIVSVVDTRPQMDLSGLAQLLNAAAASFGSRSLEQESQTTQSPPSSVLNNFIKQKFLTDLAYL